MTANVKGHEVVGSNPSSSAVFPPKIQAAYMWTDGQWNNGWTTEQWMDKGTMENNRNFQNNGAFQNGNKELGFEKAHALPGGR